MVSSKVHISLDISSHNSVCLATYNGEKFIRKQLESILCQLNVNDQLLVVDDCSKDLTVNIINSISDPRIKLIKLSSNVGHVKAFEVAIREATGKLIFLSDQDDYWLNGRYEYMLKLMSSDNILLNSSFNVVSEQGSNRIVKTFNIGKSKGLFNIYNIFFGKTYYYGCTFCFNRDLVRLILPFPSWVSAHDLYIGILANIHGKVLHLNEPTILRTVHSSNLTNMETRSFLDIFFSRVIMVRIIFLGMYKFLKK